jgi:hypothetical protein
MLNVLYLHKKNPFMIASVSINDVLRDEQQNEKIINISSAILRSVSNIPLL